MKKLEMITEEPGRIIVRCGEYEVDILTNEDGIGVSLAKGDELINEMGADFK